MEQLKLEIKELIIDSLGLEDMSPGDIDDDASLFGEGGLGLDSVDALELGLAVQKHFGFQLDKENQELRDSFTSVATLAQFVQKIKA